MLLWILRCVYLFKLVVGFLVVDIYPGVEMLKHMVVLFLGFWCFFFFLMLYHLVCVPQPGVKPRPSAVRGWNANHWAGWNFQFLVFWETCLLFPTVDAPIYIPIKSIWEFSFLRSPANICRLYSDERHSDRCEVMACGSDLPFPGD